MIVGTFCAIGAWVAILLNVNPNEANILGFALFYLTLFVGLVGLLTLSGLLYRLGIRGRTEMVLQEVQISIRHAVLLSFVCIVSLFTSAHQWFHWWFILVFIVLASLMEYVGLQMQHRHRHHPQR